MTSAAPNRVPLVRGPHRSREILGMRVDATSYADACSLILGWSSTDTGRYVGIANVNNVMESHDDPAYLAVMRAADLVTPDGMPLVWALRWLGIDGATRVYGPTLMAELCREAERLDVPIGLYGGSPDVLAALVDNLQRRHPHLRIAYAVSPPFRPASPAEDAATVDEIAASGARLLFVGLGAPKQERWMAAHRGSVDAVMVGVGAAFDFIAGAKRQAPAIMQRAGLEWLFRLMTEPRRLWRRYAKHNPRFVALLIAQLVRNKRGSGRSARGPGSGR